MHPLSNLPETEQAYLSGLLIALSRGGVLPDLQAADFADLRYGRIYAACRTLAGRGIVPDLLTLAKELPDIDPAFLADITTVVPSDANLSYYEDLIREASAERQFTLALKTAAEQQAKQVDMDTIVHTLVPALMQVTAARNARGIVTAKDLMARRFPEEDWIIEGLLGPGLTILSGAPKIGKSWLMLSLAQAVSEGGVFMGKLKTSRDQVLYLALEDTHRRIRRRLAELNNGTYEGNENLFIALEWKEGVAGLDAYLKGHKYIALVIIDTLGRFLPGIDDFNDYAKTTGGLAALKRAADDNDTAIIAVHHAKKGAARQGGDFLEQSLGSQGITGAVDATFILQRDIEPEYTGQRNERTLNPKAGQRRNTGRFQATGRDIPDSFYKMKFDPDCGSWTIAGDPPTAAVKTKEDSPAMLTLEMVLQEEEKERRKKR